jgi:hypothetical protein
LALVRIVMNLVMPQNMVFSNAVGFPPRLPRGTSRSFNHYLALITVMAAMTATEPRALSANDPSYAFSLHLRHERKTYKPTRSTARQYTTVQQHMLRSQGKQAPPPTPTPAARRVSGPTVARPSPKGGRGRGWYGEIEGAPPGLRPR